MEIDWQWRFKEMLTRGTSSPLELMVSRNGEYYEEFLFLVYEQADIKMLAEFLKIQCIYF